MGCTSSKTLATVNTNVDFKAKQVSLSTPSMGHKDNVVNDYAFIDFLPNAGFVIKTKKIANNQKIFVNVMHHHYVFETDKFITRGVQFAADKKGEACMTFTAVIPTSIYDGAVKDREMQQQVSLKVLKALNEAYPAFILDLDFKLPKIQRGYIGEEIESVRKEPLVKKKKSSLQVTEETSSKSQDEVDNASNGLVTISDSIGLNEIVLSDDSAMPQENSQLTSIVEEVVESNKPSSSINIPDRMQGWLRKRGHVVLNWKTRYFVLDNGYLTYYVDRCIPEDDPPYGREKKGQICLAGYREIHHHHKQQQQHTNCNNNSSSCKDNADTASSQTMVDIDDDVCYMQIMDDFNRSNAATSAAPNTTTTTVTAVGNEEQGLFGVRRRLASMRLSNSKNTSSSSDINSVNRPSIGSSSNSPELRIHLVLDATMFLHDDDDNYHSDNNATTTNDQESDNKAAAPQRLATTATTSTSNNNSGPIKSEFYEILLETETVSEKMAWMTAIQAHTAYIESIMQATTITPPTNKNSVNSVTKVSQPIVTVTGSSSVTAHDSNGSTSNIDNERRYALVRQLVLTSGMRLLCVDPKTWDCKMKMSLSDGYVIGENNNETTTNNNSHTVRLIDDNVFEVYHYIERKAYRFLSKDVTISAQHWVDAIEAAFAMRQ